MQLSPNPPEDLPVPDVLVGPKTPVKEAISDTQMSTG